MIMPAAVYLRVSTDEQTIESQRPACMRIVEARGFDVENRVYEEVQSGAKKLPELAKLLESARRGDFRVLVIWALDRLGRLQNDIIENVHNLDRYGVRIVSVQDPWMDTSNGAKVGTRELLLSVFAWKASQERLDLIERTKQGMARARALGRQIGGIPKMTYEQIVEAHRLRVECKLSWAKIAKRIGGISPASARRAWDMVRERGTLSGGSFSPDSTPLNPYVFGNGAARYDASAHDCEHGIDLNDDCEECGRVAAGAES